MAVLNPSKSFLALKKVNPRILSTFKRSFSKKMGKTPSSHIIHSLGGEYCWIVRDSEPIRLLKSPRSLSVYILISNIFPLPAYDKQYWAISFPCQLMILSNGRKDTSTIKSAFEWDQLPKIRRQHGCKEHLKISKVAKFESHLLQTNEHITPQSHEILQTF